MNQDIIDTLKDAKEFVGIYTKDDSDCIAHSAMSLFNHIGKLLNEISPTPSKEESSNGSIDSEEGFTDGNWQLDESEIGVTLWADDERANGIVLATIYTEAKEWEANAALICEAKNIYAALNNLINVARIETANLIAWDGAEPLDVAIDNAESIINRINKH